jgi:hypothetical protein
VNDQHARFLGRLDRSTEAVAAVASWLEQQGREVDVPAIRRAPSAKVADEYLDIGDILMICRVEVKQISRPFTCRSDWPFREYLISNKASVDRAWPNVIAYVTANPSLSHLAIVASHTRRHWYVTEKRASNTGNVESFYACKLDHVKFCSMERA